MPIDSEHQNNRKCGNHDRVGGVHDSRPQQHSNVAEIVRRPRHQVAGSIRLVKRSRQGFKMLKQVVAQLVFDIAGNADNEPPHRKAENAFTHGQSNNHQGVIGEFFPRDGLFEAVHCVTGDPRSCKKKQVRQQNAAETGGNPATVPVEMELQAAQNTPLC